MTSINYASERKKNNQTYAIISILLQKKSVNVTHDKNFRSWDTPMRNKGVFLTLCYIYTPSPSEPKNRLQRRTCLPLRQ